MRIVQESDSLEIVRAIYKFREQANEHPFFKPVSLSKALGFIWEQCAQGNAWLANGYLIIVSVSTPWYSNERMLVEQLVVKIAKGGTADDIPVVLDLLAAKLGCTKIVTSDSSPSGNVAAACSRAGYLPFSPTLYKVIPCAES